MKLPQIFKKLPSPKTFLSGGRTINYFNERPEDLNKFETIYKQGGLISQALDAYPLFILSNGYTLTGPPDKIVEISKWLYEIDIDQLMWQAIIDALIYGDGFQENVYTRKGDLKYVVPRNPKYFKIIYDEYGIIQSYVQKVDDKETSLRNEQITHLKLLSISGQPYGISLLSRAYDDIMRDTKTAESTAIAIERHGFPRYHIKTGSETEDYSEDAKKEIAKKFEELKADSEFVSGYDVKINQIDINGVGKIDVYNEWSLSRLLAAMGVPSQIIGTGESTTTYATASVEMEAFFKRISTYQIKVARVFNRLIDLKTRSIGEVMLTFNPVNPVMEAPVEPIEAPEEPIEEPEE